ncbi:hypothetical protein SO802_017478 [Lithocarpus litseifolius]|uniref:G-patch domain-containing protein n=1 Tax=Lithocarpus litseifolius TaxID=425828 RepID=A0AAW2CMW9_9ROSI
MPMADLYAYLLKRKLVTPMFAKPREGPPSPNFDPSKKCEHHFGAKGHTLKECYQLRDRVQDLIDKKLIQFNNVAALNIITNPLPPYQEGNVNAIITVEEKVPDFSSSSFPWKAMLRTLVQESHLDLKVASPASSLVQEGTAIFPAIQGFNPLILSMPASEISRVSCSKALEAILVSPVVINPKMFSMVPNLQTQEGVIIRMPMPFPYEDNHHVPWKYNVSLISTRTKKEEVCFNISLGPSGLIRSGRYYTPGKLEKRWKKIGKGVTKSSFEGMVSMVLATNHISFTDDELPPEGRKHTLPIHIMAEEPLTIFKETFIPYIGSNSVLEATFHSFELVSMISRASKLKSAWPSTNLMAAKEMLKFGYQLGQGLSAAGHGNVTLIELPKNKGGFGLGYNPSDEEHFQASKVKKRKCTGQGMSIPHIRVTFSDSAEVIKSKMA